MNEQIYTAVVAEMPPVFTSNQFCKELRARGVTQREIDNMWPFNWLQGRATRHSRRGWQKTGVIQLSINADAQIEAAVQLLKKAGYKIFKPINEYKEI